MTTIRRTILMPLEPECKHCGPRAGPGRAFGPHPDDLCGFHARQEIRTLRWFIGHEPRLGRVRAPRGVALQRWERTFEMLRECLSAADQKFLRDVRDKLEPHQTHWFEDILHKLAGALSEESSP